MLACSGKKTLDSGASTVGPKTQTPPKHIGTSTMKSGSGRTPVQKAALSKPGGLSPELNPHMMSHSAA